MAGWGDMFSTPQESGNNGNQLMQGLLKYFVAKKFGVPGALGLNYIMNSMQKRKDQQYNAENPIMPTINSSTNIGAEAMNRYDPNTINAANGATIGTQAGTFPIQSTQTANGSNQVYPPINPLGSANIGWEEMKKNPAFFEYMTRQYRR